MIAGIDNIKVRKEQHIAPFEAGASPSSTLFNNGSDVLVESDPLISPPAVELAGRGSHSIGESIETYSLEGEAHAPNTNRSTVTHHWS